MLDGYINHIRPLRRPTCDFVLVTRNGGQHNKLGELMSKLAFDATGKYVHPTRYRQIVETASSRQLSSGAQSTISEDQKHSSVVARVHYQSQRSREVASKAHEYLERLHGEKGSEIEVDVRSRLSGNSASSEDQNASQTDTSSNDEGETIAETPPERLSAVPRLKRENAFIMTDFPVRKKESDVHPCRRRLPKSRHRATRLWSMESDSQGSRISFSRGKDSQLTAEPCSAKIRITF